MCARLGSCRLSSSASLTRCAFSSQCTFASLYLEEPYGCVDSNAQRSAGVFELLKRELGQSDAPPGADLLVDTARISDTIRTQHIHDSPVNAHLASMSSAEVDGSVMRVSPRLGFGLDCC
jgi:hypothetical protein